MYDAIIIGGGPAGLSAAVYAARYRLNTLVISQNPGGYVSSAHKVDNWLGEKGIEGSKLAEMFVEHVKSFDVEIKPVNVVAIAKTKDSFNVMDSNGENYDAKKIVLATGSEKSQAGIKGEEEFFGRGVSYCATCDGFFFRDRVVAVVGGGDSAATAAELLADIASKVYLVHRRGELRACEKNQAAVLNNPKIECLLNAEIVEIAGDNVVKKAILKDGRELAVDGVFIEIGSAPAGTILKGLGVKTDDDGFVTVDQKQATNVKGVFAAGDITTNSDKLKQMITAAAEGAVAANSLYLELKEDK